MKRPGEIHAIIGVRHRGDLTYYVRRSEKMANYPSVWSLLSIQFDPDWLDDPEDLDKVQQLLIKMSEERLGGVPIELKEHVTSGDSDRNPMNEHVHLHLYEIELPEEPILNPDYYSDAAWLSPEQYEEKSTGQKCGLCLRLWSDHAWMAGISDRPFVARAAE